MRFWSQSAAVPHFSYDTAANFIFGRESHARSYEQLPITLTANHVAAALGISRANAYILLRSDGFPTLHIGKRMVVPKDRFLQWITDSVNG